MKQIGASKCAFLRIAFTFTDDMSVCYCPQLLMPATCNLSAIVRECNRVDDDDGQHRERTFFDAILRDWPAKQTTATGEHAL